MNKIIQALTVVAAFAAQVLSLSALADESSNLLVNGSFETPRNMTRFYEFHASGAEGLGWQALSLDRQVEIGSVKGAFGSLARSAYGATRASDGYQFAELSANAVGALFQKVTTVPGKTYRWGWSRKARFATEATAFWTLSPEKFKEAVPLYLQYLRGEKPLSEIRPAVQALTNECFVCHHADVEVSEDTVSWKRYEGTYTVPAGQTETYVVLVEWNENPRDSQGCLVDGVVFFDSDEVLMRRGIVGIENTKGGTATVTIDGKTVTLGEGTGAYDFYETNKTLAVSVETSAAYTFLGAFVSGYVNETAVYQNGVAFLPADRLAACPVRGGSQHFALAYGKDCTISFLPNGGTYERAEKTLAKTAGSNFVPGVPTRAASVFMGWRERTTLKMLKKNVAIIWKDGRLVATAADGSLIIVPAADGLQLLACWTRDNDLIPVGHVEFADGFGESRLFELNRNDSMPAAANPKFQHRENFVEYDLVGWRLPSFQKALSTNVTAVYVGVPNAAKGDATDGVMKFMDVQGHALAITNCPGVMLEAIWEVKHTNEWAVLNTAVLGGTPRYFDALSAALKVLKKGDTLLARPPAEGFGVGEGLKPDTNDVITVDCPFTITTDDVTVDLNGRVLNRSADGQDGDYLMSVVGAKGVTIRNGYLFGVKESYDHQSYGPQACRGLKVDNLAGARVEDAALYYSPYAESVLVDRQSELIFVRCYLDGDGDGAVGVVLARENSALSLKDCKGLWNEGNFWNNPLLDGSLDNVTGEQFALDASALVLDNTVVSNSYDNTASGKALPYIVTTRGESEIVLLNGAKIREGAKGTTQGAICVEDGTCTVGSNRDGLKLAEGHVIGKLVEKEGATLIAGAANYNDDPTAYLSENGQALARTGSTTGLPYWSVVESSGSKSRDAFQYLVKGSGIENIHVNKVVPYIDPISGLHYGDLSMWLKMTEGGLAQKIYQDRYQRDLEGIISNSVPDALFPTNTLMAHVWRGRGVALTNAYNVLSTDVAKTIFDPEVVELLKKFGPLAESVTRGVGSATIPYVDAEGNQKLGQAVVFGAETNSLTCYETLVGVVKQLGGLGREESFERGIMRFTVTNEMPVSVFGSVSPIITRGSLGYVTFSSSQQVLTAVRAAAIEYETTGKKPYYDGLRAVAAARDAEMKKQLGADYARPYTTDGFERFGYADLSKNLVPTMAKMISQLGIDPAIIGTNKVFRHLATLCSETGSPLNDRMRIDIHGNPETLRLIEGSMRVTDLFLENAGLVEKDFMTFDGEWKFDPETLAKVKGFATVIREEMGLNGIDYWFKESDDRTTVFADVGYVPGKKFEQLFCAGKAGGREENPCEACLPSNTVAAFSFQPSAAVWTELNERLFTLLGLKTELLDQIFAMFKSHSKSFGKSASVGVVLGSSSQAIGSLKVSNGLDLVSSIKIEDENLWYSLRILLEQFGCKTRVSERYPSVTVCELTNSTLRVAYDRNYKIVKLQTSSEVGFASAAALRNSEARLISSANKVFNDRMGIKEGETLPDHNTLFYFAPETDAVLVATLKEYLDSIGLGALQIALEEHDLSDNWLCGYGVKDGNGVFSAKSNISKDFWDTHHPFFKASCKTFGQIMAAAFPYDASKARVFTLGKMQIHVSRADNWDDVNGCLFDYTGDNIRFRIQGTNSKGQSVDRVFNGRLEANGFFEVVNPSSFDRGYFTSEGVFAEFKGEYAGYYIGRETTEIEPELSVLPSAEEIADQLKEVVDAIGVESVFVGAAKSNGTDRAGEPAVVRETTIVPIEGGKLDKLLSKKGLTAKTRISYYMPSNTIFGVSARVADGAITNVFAEIKNVQPMLAEWIEKLLLGVGLDVQQIGDSVDNAFALGLARQEEDLEPYLAVRLKAGKRQNWVTLTNGLYHATGVMVTDFQASQTPGVWESICFTFVDPVSRRQQSRCFTRVFESDDRDPVFIITSDDNPRSGLVVAVRKAGLHGLGCLRADETFLSCKIEQAEADAGYRGFTYLAPTDEGLWFYDGLFVTGDDELVIRRRCSAAVAPLDVTAKRFLVNFLEALTGEKPVVEFENDPEADAVAEAATSNVVAVLRKMRTKLGVTGLDFYDADPDEDGRYGNSELAIGTKGDGCEFLKRFAADAPASEHLVEQYIPATAAAMAKGNAEPGFLIDDINTSMKALADLASEKYPEVAATITNFLASEEWRISMESMRLTGTHKAMAVLQDLENPFVKDLGDGTYAGISAGYSVLSVFGPMESSMPFLLIKQALTEKDGWHLFTTNGVEYVIHNGQFKGQDLSQFIRPTFAFNAADNVMIFATSLKAARLAVLAGRDGTNRLVDSATFADVMGFKPGEPMREHNTLVYFAPQNDDILGCTLRRILSPYLPESYAMLLDRPSLKGYWGGAYGVRVGDAFRLYVHAGMKGHTAFLAAGQALLKTAAESMRVRQPYNWTEPKVFRSADRIIRVEPTDVKDDYAVSSYTDVGRLYAAAVWNSTSNNPNPFYYQIQERILCRHIALVLSKGGVWKLDGGRDSCHLYMLDEEADSSSYQRGVAIKFEAYEQTLPAGEKVNQQFLFYPAEAKVAKVMGLPMGLSVKKTKDGYFLTGTPTKVGEDCHVVMIVSCAGCQTTTRNFHFMVSNYASDYAELDAGYDLTAGIDDTLMLTNVAGWTASGLPSGMKFDKKTGALSGTPAKPGEYLVSFTTKINGKTEKVSTVITVDQGDGIHIATGFSEKTSELAEDGETREIYVGVKINWPIEVKGLEDVATTLSAKGLPSGLKLVKTTDKLTGEVSYSIQGIATKASSVDRKTGEMKPSTVVLSGTNKYKWSGVETFDLVVKALPDWAIGTFNGYDGSVQGDICASVKVTASSVGKISINVSGVSPATHRVLTDSFACTGFDSYDPLNKCFAFVIENAKWKESEPSRFSGAIGLDKDLAQVGLEVGRYISCTDAGEDLLIQAASNYNWGKWTFPIGKNQLTLELTDSINPGLEGLTLKFAKGGKVTVAGSVTDRETGKKVSVSASSVLVNEPHNDGVFGDGILRASVGFVVRTATPFYAYVPLWVVVDEDGNAVAVYKTDPARVGICTWCWGANMTDVLDYMDQANVKNMSLALMSWLKPSDGSQYESPFGFPETEEMFEAIGNKIASGDVRVNSTMLSFPHEDWSTYESISNTVGIMYTADPADPTGEKAWTVHSNLVEQAAILTQKLGVEHLTCFVGFLMKPIVVGGVDVNADGAIGLARLHAAHQFCDKYGVKLLLESGHYSGAETMAILAAYEKKYGAGKLPLAINFDAANHLAYGNDTPRVAYDAMKSRIGQVHIKDALEGTTGGGFAVDVMWGTGDVSGKYDLLGYLREQGYAGDLLVECEAGENRFAYIAAALKALR